LADMRATPLLHELERTGHWEFARFAALVEQTVQPAGRARIVLREPGSVPAATTDALVEPVVITPGLLARGRISPLWLLLAPVGVLALAWLPRLTHSPPPSLPCAVLVLVALGWLWLVVLRPNYLRFTPGEVA